jgi:hypothetical protein
MPELGTGISFSVDACDLIKLLCGEVCNYSACSFGEDKNIFLVL